MSQGYFPPLTQAPISQMTHFLHLLPITLQLAQTNCDKVPLESTWQRQLSKQSEGCRIGHRSSTHSQGVPRVQEQPHIGHCAILTRCHPTLRWGQEQQEPSTAQSQCSQCSWSSSQWDTAGKDKRKSSKNKVCATQCTTPLKTGAALEHRPR